MKTVDHSYEQALIMHDNVHIHVIMNIIMTPTPRIHLGIQSKPPDGFSLQILKFLKDPTCAIFLKNMGVRDIKYDIPVFQT